MCFVCFVMLGFAAIGCGKSTFTKNGECVQCSVGQYNDQVGQSNCKNCIIVYHMCISDNKNVCKKKINIKIALMTIQAHVICIL